MRLAAVAAVFALLAFALAKTVRVQSDFTAFLPRTTTAEQRLLVAQLRQQSNSILGTLNAISKSQSSDS